MLNTERTHPKAIGIDKQSCTEILTIMHEAHVDAVLSVKDAIHPLVAGAKAMAKAVDSGHKLVYAAAGSSGTQCLADGLEITPTFGVPLSQVSILRAGGFEDLTRPKGDMEDNIEAALTDAKGIKAGDCVICVAASGRTVYPVVIMNYAKECGATTIGIANNPDTDLLQGADIPIYLPTPPELIAGSTRLGAGTAQKIALNMMSSLMGILLGHVMDGLMVNVMAINAKLFHRAENMVMNITKCSRETAASNLKLADGQVKEAVLLVEGATDLLDAQRRLNVCAQNLRHAINDLRPT